MKNNKSFYQDCPNCWGYQEYEKNDKEKDLESSSSRQQKKTLFTISGTEVEEDDLLYKF